jgi:hypothetical protein
MMGIQEHGNGPLSIVTTGNSFTACEQLPSNHESCDTAFQTLRQTLSGYTLQHVIAVYART